MPVSLYLVIKFSCSAYQETPTNAERDPFRDRKSKLSLLLRIPIMSTDIGLLSPYMHDLITLSTEVGQLFSVGVRQTSRMEKLIKQPSQHISVFFVKSWQVAWLINLRLNVLAPSAEGG